MNRATKATPAAGTLTVDNLHRYHVTPSKGVRLDLEDFSYRPDAGQHVDRAVVAAAARRMMLCWNVLEGIRTDDLESGILRKTAEATLLLLEELRCTVLPPEARKTLAHLEHLFKQQDASFDVTHGRLNDCEGCIAREARELAEAEAQAEEEESREDTGGPEADLERFALNPSPRPPAVQRELAPGMGEGARPAPVTVDARQMGLGL